MFLTETNLACGIVISDDDLMIHYTRNPHCAWKAHSVANPDWSGW